MTATTTAARVMGTAISRRVLWLAACLPLAAAGCAGSGGRAGSPRAVTPFASPPGGGIPALQPQAAPASWRSLRIPSGAVLFYPPDWRPASADRGSATAQAMNGRGRIVGYLNLTPRQSRETLTDWTRFRVAHNIAEGERSVRREGAMTGVRFRAGIGSCVRDSYTTSVDARYIELACLVRGSKTSTVIVAAAPPADWKRVAPLLERSLSALLT